MINKQTGIRFWATVFFSVCLVACMETAPKPTIIDEHFTPSEDSLFIACADLKGFGPFAIDKMTYREYLNSKDIKVDKVVRYSSFYNGYWAQGKDKDSDTRFALSKHLEKKGFRQVEFASLAYPFVVGDVKLENMDAIFWNDVLVAIYTDITYAKHENNVDKLREHFIEKYGDGRGINYYYHVTDWTEQKAKNNTVSSSQDKREEREWTNGKVSVFYSDTDQFRIVRGTITSMNHKTYYLVKGARYEAFLEAIENECMAFFKDQAETNAAALSSF